MSPPALATSAYVWRTGWTRLFADDLVDEGDDFVVDREVDVRGRREVYDEAPTKGALHTDIAHFLMLDDKARCHEGGLGTKIPKVHRDRHQGAFAREGLRE